MASSPDPEVVAIMHVTAAMENLDQIARDRVLLWAIDRYGSDAIPRKR